MPAWSKTLLAPLFAACCGWAQTDIYRPYRFADRWHADTLYLGASFRYTGTGDINVSIEWGETAGNGQLYAIDPASGRQVFVMTNRAPQGTVVNLSRLIRFAPGDEVVFAYMVDDKPLYTGPSARGSRYFNRISSDNNLNPNLRFGRRTSVAGKLPGNMVEFGFEDYYGAISDMDYNDIHFHASNLDLLIYMRAAKQRSYVW